MAILFGDYDVTDRLIHATSQAFAFPAQMPIVPGHVLVCPRRIVQQLEDLRAEEVQALFILVARIKAVLVEEFGATGFNVAWNEGSCAGQTVPHLHIHVVPRKSGDTGVVGYEPRQFLYRPGVRQISPDAELVEVAKMLARHF